MKKPLSKKLQRKLPEQLADDIERLLWNSHGEFLHGRTIHAIMDRVKRLAKTS
jgi:ribulose-5-phosphate 4-epimerase/fuculose-1-phosphate aldolase